MAHIPKEIRTRTATRRDATRRDSRKIDPSIDDAAPKQLAHRSHGLHRQLMTRGMNKHTVADWMAGWLASI